MRYAILLLVVTASSALATPCPSLGIRPGEAAEHADWIVEGTIAGVKSSGSFKDCERTPDGGSYCAAVQNPEVITLEKIHVIRSNGQLREGASLDVVRASHCFSGALSVMNSKPELTGINRRWRFYGGNLPPAPHVQSGYFWVEPAE